MTCLQFTPLAAQRNTTTYVTALETFMQGKRARVLLILLDLLHEIKRITTFIPQHGSHTFSPHNPLQPQSIPL